MKTTITLQFIFLSVMGVLLSSCVPKATEKKAVCGTNQSFNSVTRSCVSIVEPRTKPQALLTSASLSQETASTLTLTYKDGNGDKALSCKITSISSNIEVMSPELTSGAIFTIADNMVIIGSNMAGNIPNPGDNALAVTEVNSMRSTLDLAKTTYNMTNLLSLMSVFETHLATLNSIAGAYTSAYPLVKSYFNSLTAKTAEYTTAKTTMDNHCECAGGVCTAVVAPKKGMTGTAGFTYTITDIDGEGAPGVVNLTIAATSKTTNYLAPSVASTYYAGSESQTSTPTAISFSLGSAADYFSTGSFTYSHGKTVSSAYFATFGITKTYVNSDTGLGKITNCLGLGGSASTDTTCDYVPNDGDAYSSTTPAKASAVIGGLTFRALVEGSAGNSLKIVYKDLSTDVSSLDGGRSTTAEKYGLAAYTNDVYLRVIGDTIYVIAHDGVTTNQEIKNAIVADPVASKLVSVPVWDTNPVSIADASAGVNLSGGVTGYDTFSYTVSNGFNTSSNTAVATIQVASSLDYPYWKRAPSATSPLIAVDGTGTTYLEGSSAISFSVPLSSVVTDVDSVITTCTVSTSSLDLVLSDVTGVTIAQVDKTYQDFVYTLPAPAPSCSVGMVGGVKSAIFSIDRSYVTKSHAWGEYGILFSLGNGGVLTTGSPTYHAYRFNITPVNDRPDITAIDWSTTSPLNTPTTTLTGTGAAFTVKENSTGNPSSSYVIFTVNPDNTATGYETSQTLTLTATSSNQTLLKDSSITVTNVDATHKRIDFVTEANQSSLTPVTITVTLKDNGGTATTGSVDTYTTTLSVTVNQVNDPPYFTAPANGGVIETNEGGMVTSMAFNVQEDQGNSVDEDTQYITVTSITSDNTAVIDPSNITVFYDLNDNGVEDSGEARAVGIVGTAGGGGIIGVDRVGDKLETSSVDSGLHNFYLKLKPTAGIAGNANITVTVSDQDAGDVYDSTHYLTKTFSLVVHSVAANHGGWANLQAVGIKTDKNGAPVSTADMKCNYNLSTDPYKCMNGSTAMDCTRSGAPHGLITPTAENVIFYDSANKKCYRSTSASMYSWVDLTTSCPITRIKLSNTALSAAISSGATTIAVTSTSGFPAAGMITIDSEKMSYTGKTATSFTGVTRGASGTTAAAHANAATVAYTANGTNFIKDLSLTPAVGTPTSTAKDQYYYDAVGKVCYKSKESSPGVWGWDTSTYSPSKVTLAWNPFSISTSGADATVSQVGWNVYRREAGEDYDFINGYLRNADETITTMTINNANTRSFTDTTAVAGKIYYYLVRPVDSAGRTISTPDVFSEVRVLAPTDNYAFVHRWIVNQEICNSMHMTTTTTNKVDPTHNYRCPYKGPGESSTSPGYYDIGKDMLVDISESGCPYTAAPACNTGNGCIGIGDPTTVTSGANTNDVYYDRSSGMCYRFTGTVWEDFNSTTLNATIVAQSNTALNPPLTNITKARASAICAARSSATPLANLGIAKGAAADPVSAPELPSKKEYVAYSAAPFGMPDSTITDLEQGYSLNVQSRCNSSNANGIEAAFNDSPIPSASYIFSLPGTASSTIRSIYTGSIPFGINFSTESCSSRYGVQDVYGNVAEWVKDSMTCLGNTTSYTTTLNGAITAAATSITVASTANFTNSKSITIGSERMTITSVPNGTTLVVVRGANGTTAAAHSNGDTVTANDTFVCRSVAGASGTELGRYDFSTGTYTNTPSNQYAFDLIVGPYNDQNADSLASQGDSFLTEWDFRDELFSAGKFSFPMGMPINVDIASSLSTAPGLSWLLDIGPTSGLTSSQLHEDGLIVNSSAVNDSTGNPTQTGSFAQGGSYLSGNRAGRYSSELIPDADLRSDVGFRCVIPIDKTNYPADTGRHTYSY